MFKDSEELCSPTIRANNKNQVQKIGFEERRVKSPALNQDLFQTSMLVDNSDIAKLNAEIAHERKTGELEHGAPFADQHKSATVRQQSDTEKQMLEGTNKNNLSQVYSPK